MKILYIAPDITDSGGISRVLSVKTNYLVSQKNYEISILSLNDCSCIRFYDFNSKIKWFNLKETNNRLLFLGSYIRFIKKTIGQENPDRIVVCDAVLWWLIPWFVKTKIPMIFETHFSIHFKKNNNDSVFSRMRFHFVRFLKQKSIDKFSCFVCLTLEELKARKSKKGIIISNPLPFIATAPAALKNKKAMAVCLNPFVKGLDRLLLIWSKIVEKHPDWVLDIYGKWEAHTNYIKMAHDLNVSNHVDFLSPTTDILYSYSQSSVFLMTSRFEVFPMVILEAMASGVPCIAYDCPTGPRAIIKNEKNGFLIDDDNTDAFVQKLELLIQNHDLRIQMGRNAQESTKKYQIEAIMNQWEQLFLNLKTNL